VELTTGTWRTASSDSDGPATERAIVDLPGTYSLLARSVDEQVSADAVRELAQSASQDIGRPGVVVVVLDATALTRSLYLLAQVAETGVPLVVALTMLDLLASAADSPIADRAAGRSGGCARRHPRRTRRPGVRPQPGRRRPARSGTRPSTTSPRSRGT